MTEVKRAGTPAPRGTDVKTPRCAASEVTLASVTACAFARGICLLTNELKEAARSALRCEIDAHVPWCADRSTTN